ncbi:thiolase family protein [Microterricola viridarii]|uniref:Probable acetyl-CoA acetyltransferase n=1 Tax=Microterricola viridarii TaxID=412690 RepID=A0A0Y0MUA0_9MICO|nr:thiolase family protein [Microterricola viridarii]AMB58072.1 acetyl-CoA acetyltransferase [Microterricola viridarii]
MFDHRSPVIVAARRTAITSTGRALAQHSVDALAASVLRAVADELAPAGRSVGEVILGNCMGPGGNVSRLAALRAGLGDGVPAVTVDRQCGSGLEAVLQAGRLVRSGDAELVLAGGAESASTAPWRFWPPQGEAAARRYTRAPFAPDGWPDPDMGEAADAVAARFGIGRARQDDWAARSHHLASAHRDRGGFDGEIVAVDGERRDDRPRATLDTGRLGRFTAAFSAGGTVTAGNSCGVSDGAAAMAVTTEAVRAELGLPGLRIVATAAAGSDPALPGIGAVAAVERLLADTGVRVSELDAIEITEAFAAQVLAVSDLLGLDEERICTDGGAIALGHPWGASGAVLLVRLAARMFASDNARYGLAACSIGGGQGLAMLVERAA